MPELALPPSPTAQIELHSYLERTLTEWGVSFRHEDRSWESRNGREAICGWGTRIERGRRLESIDVWFDYLDTDIMITSADKRVPYREWRELTDMATVLEEIRTVLREVLVPGG